jgi:hypothetical protein
MPLQTLLQQIAWATTSISLIATAVAALSWGFASLIRGSPIPWREFKEFGEGLGRDAIKSMLYLAAWSSIAALVTWVVTVIATAQ